MRNWAWIALQEMLRFDIVHETELTQAEIPLTPATTTATAPATTSASTSVPKDDQEQIDSGRADISD